MHTIQFHLEEKEMSSQGNPISRRNFLKSAAVVSAAGVSAGVLGACSPKVADTGTTGANGASAQGTQWSWEAAPKAIPASEIKQTVDAEVLVIGAGLAGLAAAIAAVESGAKATIIEKK
jgi:ribulose 1,5-bisphosphate synthetase/thiazole synthase